MTITAQLIASLMQANCTAYHAGSLTRATWSAEQQRLWDVAGQHRCASDVLRLVVPPLVPPPYAVRKQLREATLKVGR